MAIKKTKKLAKHQPEAQARAASQDSVLRALPFGTASPLARASISRPLRIIPVIDLKDGVVVRGVAGKRSEYRPLVSPLCQSPEPLAVAQALVNKFCRPELYVADLDAIAGGEPAWSIYEQLARCGPRLLVDAGIADVARAKALAEFRVDATGGAGDASLSGVIAGLESVDSPRLLAELIAAVGRDRLIFSLDLQQGRSLTTAPAWRDKPPATIAAIAVDAGVRRMIVLDLADVGVGQGVSTLDLCRQLRLMHPHCELISGGGVRGPADLVAMSAAGCDAALVASALHDGRIGNAE